MSLIFLQVPGDYWDPSSLTDLSDAPNGPEAAMVDSGGSQKRHSSERVDSEVTGK